jgi:hypothetical protein
MVTVTVTVTDSLLNTSYRKVYTLPPSCPGCYTNLFRAPLHEVLPKPSPPLHVLESGYGVTVMNDLLRYSKCKNQPAPPEP